MYTLNPVNYGCTTNMVFMFVLFSVLYQDLSFLFILSWKSIYYFSALAILTYDNFVWEIVSISCLFLRKPFDVGALKKDFALIE